MSNLENFNEFNKNIIKHDPILEMARINNKKDFNYDVFVYGGNSYMSGRNEHGDPHFHFADKIKTGKWEFSILIPTVEQWKQSKELYIIESTYDHFEWIGHNKDKKKLIKWLDKSFNKTMKNIEMIRQQWNILNCDNNNVKQLKKIFDDE